MNDNTLTEAINVGMGPNQCIVAIVALLNHKFAVNYDNEDKAEVLTEVLNDVKLLLQPTTSSEVH